MGITGSQRVELRRTVDESYPIYFGENLFPEIAWDIKQSCGDLGRYAIITDSNVKLLYARKLSMALNEKGLRHDVFSFEAGEKSKTVKTAIGIAEDMLNKNFGRGNTIILALGGGVVGDLAGWIAANYMRGIPYIQIATTITSQADSSVGGKTGVDFPQAKNPFGAFKQPCAVYIDVETIKTLPEREVRSGLAETIKHGVIKDAKFFGRLEEISGDLVGKSSGALLEIAMANCRIKGEVVQEDPKEKGLRKILNYGHTAGHAIEKLSGFEFTHGDCVSMGMMVVGRIADFLGTGFNYADLIRQKALLEKVGLPTTIPAEISNEDIIRVTSKDKKAINGEARYCLPNKIGGMCPFHFTWARPVGNDVVIEALNATR